MRHTIARDGIVAGILGATAVALWFLGLDVIYRHAFATPSARNEPSRLAVPERGQSRVT